MKKVKHIIVTRFALKWRFAETNLKNWDRWLDDSIHLMESFCRPSLKNQTNQDFTLLSIVDNSVKNYGNMLENEVILKVPTIKKNGYPKQQMINVINEYIAGLEGFDSVILTRLDRDDALRNDYIDNVQGYLSDNVESYVDLRNSISYDYDKKEAHDLKKYSSSFVSPFVSVHEAINNGKIKCISLLVDHNEVSSYLKGRKVNDLYAMQVVHQNNIGNKVRGVLIKINKTDYGI